MVKGWGLRPGAFVAAVFLFIFGIAAPAGAQQQCGPMDVVFVVDNSGSMTNVISEIQTQVAKIADAVQTASGGDYQFGLIAMPSDNVDVRLDLSPNNRAAFDTAVDTMSTVGSCGGGISYDEAFDTILNKRGPRSGANGAQNGTWASDFRSNAVKIIILITDTGPDGFDCDLGTHGANAVDLATQLGAKGVRITGVFVPTGGGTDPAIDIPIMQDVVAASGGLFKQTAPDASNLSDVIVDIINECGGQIPADAATMTFNPREIFVTNQDVFDAFMTDFIASPDGTPFTYTATGLPEDSTVTFIPTTPDPAFPGTTAQTVRFTIGPDTPQGTYPVIVTASHPSVQDRFAVALVFVDCDAPFLFGTAKSQPQSQTVNRGATAQLSVGAQGTGPFRYQWYNGSRGSTLSPIAGATGKNLTTGPINDTQNFWVRVFGPCGSVDSKTVTVTPR